jgi:RNA ligase (TIGR02306 family)
MTEFHVEVVRLGEIESHPNADRLEITRVHGGYPCILRKGEFKTGDLVIYVPIDTILPDIEMFSFLDAKDRKRLRAKRLRGVFSMGLIVPALPDMVEGQDVAEVLGIVKYEPQEPITMTGENESPPVGWFFPHYTDIDGLRRYKDVLSVGEEVVMTEKIHGANGRFVHDGSHLWVGSRTCIKRRDENNLWWKVALAMNLEERLVKAPRMVFFGEVYGQVQDLKYGHSGKNTASFRVFDVFDTVESRYLDHDNAVKLATELGFDWVPTLYCGPWDPELKALAEGNSQLAEHVREGFVVKPVRERYDDRLGRVILKLHGEGFLTRKE